MDDERLYAQVVWELHHQGPIPGLWAKAYAEANGNEAQAKALYLRYRVEQLAQAERTIINEPPQQRDNIDLDDLYAEVKNNFSKHAPYLLGIVIVAVIIISSYLK